ncbi:helix-turn-helix domain-containing protein [Lyngbya sp. CCY1209]|jgi:DNA-binding HxlR family transcriptional regulator|uniref:winged helix-turn-helix transcriptional regulator n=1 Tax=Lyngbya sp. CCY1209 TaxID=2886103 RepID=UPI002D2011E4|nr:helix-turn-helix domain-containing protein [Lyngbya sp. CCY1209]MEB3887286.1 helix-turn-helix transcriptional regulator [Lyngbya sp. CCY1209]
MKVTKCCKTPKPHPQSGNSKDCDRPCPIEHILEQISSKWSILILRELFGGNRRTHELQEVLPVSTKTLTLRLRELEKHDIIERKVYPEIPPRVEYSLTSKGRELQPVLDALQQVGWAWLSKDEES